MSRTNSSELQLILDITKTDICVAVAVLVIVRDDSLM